MDSRFRGNDVHCMRRSSCREKAASFFGMLAIYAPAGKCSCISGVHALHFVRSRFRFSGCWRSTHPPENACISGVPSFFGMQANDAPAENCSCIFGVHADYFRRSRFRFSGCWQSMHPPENAPAFPAYTLTISGAAGFVFRDAGN